MLNRKSARADAALSAVKVCVRERDRKKVCVRERDRKRVRQTERQTLGRG